jgi:hypothetical protein
VLTLFTRVEACLATRAWEIAVATVAAAMAHVARLVPEFPDDILEHRVNKSSRGITGEDAAMTAAQDGRDPQDEA